ncbi:MAG: hypothetical protein R2912_13020 [Eubacteriales bacterium]
MVFVWSHLTKGNPAYAVVRVRIAFDRLVAFTPIVALLLGIGVTSWDTLLLSVALLS